MNQLPAYANSPKMSSNNLRTPNGRPICNFCRFPGHIKRTCPRYRNRHRSTQGITPIPLMSIQFESPPAPNQFQIPESRSPSCSSCGLEDSLAPILSGILQMLQEIIRRLPAVAPDFHPSTGTPSKSTCSIQTDHAPSSPSAESPSPPITPELPEPVIIPTVQNPVPNPNPTYVSSRDPESVFVPPTPVAMPVLPVTGIFPLSHTLGDRRKIFRLGDIPESWMREKEWEIAMVYHELDFYTPIFGSLLINDIDPPLQKYFLSHVDHGLQVLEKLRLLDDFRDSLPSFLDWEALMVQRGLPCPSRFSDPEPPAPRHDAIVLSALSCDKPGLVKEQVQLPRFRLFQSLRFKKDVTPKKPSFSLGSNPSKFIRLAKQYLDFHFPAKVYPDRGQDIVELLDPQLQIYFTLGCETEETVCRRLVLLNSFRRSLPNFLDWKSLMVTEELACPPPRPGFGM